MSEEAQESKAELVMAEVVVEPTPDSVIVPTPGPSALQKAADWAKKHWARVRLGHEGVMLDRIQRVQRIGEITARNAMAGDMGDVTGWPDSEEGEKMGVDIGDSTVHYHYYGKEQQPGNATAKPKDGGTAEKKPMSKLAKASLVAALLSWSAVGGVAVLWALGAFDREPPAAVETPVDKDTVMQVELE